MSYSTEPFEGPTPQFRVGDRVENLVTFEFEYGPLLKHVTRGEQGQVLRMVGPHLVLVAGDAGYPWQQQVWSIKLVEEASHGTTP